MKTIKLSEIKKSLVGFDLFICDSSFENRCLEVASRLDNQQFRKIIICHFEENYKEANENLIRLKERLPNNHVVVELTKDNPLVNYDRLYDELNKLGYNNALFDISTFTREMFLIIIQLFRQEDFLDKKLTLCYNPSDKYYSIPKNELHKLWLSKGVSNIRSILGYSGDFSPIKRIMLIVLVGFEAERSQVLIENFEPSLLYIGKAPKSNSANDDLAEINEFNFNKILKLNPNAIEFEFSCLEISPTVQTLSYIIEENRDLYNIVISPMSNKLSTLAVASTVFKYPEVQICYASTNLYNIHAYSTSSDSIHLINAEELL
jgi:hypothetical protein